MAVVMHSVVGPTAEGGVTKIGVLLLEVGATSFRHLLSIEGPDGREENQSRIEFDRDHPFTWTHLYFVEGGKLVDIGRPDPGKASVPFQAGWLVAKFLAEEKDKTEVVCSVLRTTAEPVLEPAKFVQEGDTVTLYIADEPRTRFRLRGADILAIEWGGKVATVVTESADLMAGLSPEVKRAAGVFLVESDKT